MSLPANANRTFTFLLRGICSVQTMVLGSTINATSSTTSMLIFAIRRGACSYVSLVPASW